jgi:hypothetical protein
VRSSQPGLSAVPTLSPDWRCPDHPRKDPEQRRVAGHGYLFCAEPGCPRKSLAS